MFKPDEAACLLAEQFNIIGWIYKQEPIIFNRLASRLAALPTWTRPLTNHNRLFFLHSTVIGQLPLKYNNTGTCTGASVVKW